MEQNKQYPRVLIVTIIKVKAYDHKNLLIRQQFGAWPRNRLAQIHSGEIDGRGDFCGRYYQIQSDDRFCGRIFTYLRRHVAEIVERPLGNPNVTVPQRNVLGRMQKAAKRYLRFFLVETGIWEACFRIRVSVKMAHFIQTFNPEIIYCQGYSLGFATLPLLISKQFSIPICFQTTDDWPNSTYRGSPIRWWLRRRAGQLVRNAKMRIAFGEKMRIEYERRYRLPFEVTYHLDNRKRFPARSVASRDMCRIVYAGSLGHRRYEAIQDLIEAARLIKELAGRFEVVVYSVDVPGDIATRLLNLPELKMAPLPNHDTLPTVLSEATILLLPESFGETREAIEYSVSTKAHLFMMSGCPVLVYGPAYSGTVDYAIRGGWGFVVAERSVDMLREALKEILAKTTEMHWMRRNAEFCILNHHDLTTGRERFLRILSRVSKSTAESV